MASAFDELLGNLVNKLKSAGVGSKTAAQKRAEIDYLTPSNISAQSGQATMRDYPYYYGRGDAPATSYSADIPSRKFYDPLGYGSETGGGYSRGGLFKNSLQNTDTPTIADTMRGAVPDAISEYEMRQLQIEQRIRDEEDANAPKDQGFGQSTLERKLYDAKIAEDRRRREELVKNNIPIERRANEERRMLSQAQTEKERRGLFDYGGMDMRSQQQTIDIDPIVLEIPDQPTDEEVIRTLEQDYADLAAAGADTATLSELAREIDSYRDRQSSLPSIVSEAAASDVIENAPVNYDAFGKVIAKPETEVLMSRQAQIVDPTKVYTYSELTKTPGAMYQRDSAVKEVERRLGRELSAGEATLVRDEGFVTVPYKDLDKTAIGMGQQGKYYTPDNILEGFELAIKDKKEQMKTKFGNAYPKDEKKEWALINLAYRGDVQPGWSSKFKAGDIQGAEKEFWNNASYRKLLQKEKQGKPTELLNRLRRNAKDLFGFSSF